MIEEKFVEIRDAGTTIPALAFRIQGAGAREIAFMRAAGYGHELKEQMEYIFLLKLDGLQVECDPFDWTSGARTMQVAHVCLVGPSLTLGFKDIDQARAASLQFDRLPHEGKALIDVEYVLGLSAEPKVSEYL